MLLGSYIILDEVWIFFKWSTPLPKHCLKQSTVLQLVPAHSYTHTNNLGRLWTAETFSIAPFYLRFWFICFCSIFTLCQCFEAAENRDTSQLFTMLIQANQTFIHLLVLLVQARVVFVTNPWSCAGIGYQSSRRERWCKPYSHNFVLSHNHTLTSPSFIQNEYQ